MVADDARQDRILDAAGELISHFGYDKTTVREIADAAGVSKGTIYLHFDSKAQLFEALLVRELMQHGQAWIEAMEADPQGGTIGGIYRTVLTVRSGSPLITAILQRNRQILGAYLDRPDNLLAGMYGSGMGPEIFEEFQKAGVIRDDVDPETLAHLGDVIDYGLMTIGEVKPAEMSPTFATTVELVAQMMERSFAPEDGGDSEAGKAIMRRYMEKMHTFLDATRSA